jgi:hypothetical protein
MSAQAVQHYVDQAATGIAKASNATDPTAAAFWMGSAQVASNLALMEAVRENTAAQSKCGHGNTGVCMTCLRDALTGAV